MAEETVMEITYIVKTPGVLGGDPHIAGHRIGVHDIADLHVHLNVPVEEIARGYDLTLAEIYAALSYYYDHRDEIEAIIRENRSRAHAIQDDERMAQLRAKVEERMRRRNQGNVHEESQS